MYGSQQADRSFMLVTQEYKSIKTLSYEFSPGNIDNVNYPGIIGSASN
jgi:hypothetical protein